MMQFQSQDETGYLEIETGGSVFFRDREGEERYLQWEELDGVVQDYLTRFVEEAETAFDDAMDALQDIASGVEEDEADEED